MKKQPAIPLISSSYSPRRELVHHLSFPLDIRITNRKTMNTRSLTYFVEFGSAAPAVSSWDKNCKSEHNVTKGISMYTTISGPSRPKPSDGTDYDFYYFSTIYSPEALITWTDGSQKECREDFRLGPGAASAISALAKTQHQSGKMYETAAEAETDWKNVTKSLIDNATMQ